MLCQLGAQVYIKKNYSTFGTQVGPILFNTSVSYSSRQVYQNHCYMAILNTFKTISFLRNHCYMELISTQIIYIK